MRKNFATSLVIIAGLIAGVMVYSYAGATNNYIDQIQKTPAAQVAGSVNERTEYGVVIDDANSGPQAYTNLVDIDKEITALELLQKTAQSNDLQIELKSYTFGTIVESLVDRANGDENMYWIFYVNDEVATTGPGDYVMQAGDVIKFSFEKSIF